MRRDETRRSPSLVPEFSNYALGNEKTKRPHGPLPKTITTKPRFEQPNKYTPAGESLSDMKICLIQ